jgi:hypothetical protein
MPKIMLVPRAASQKDGLVIEVWRYEFLSSYIEIG